MQPLATHADVADMMASFWPTPERLQGLQVLADALAADAADVADAACVVDAAPVPVAGDLVAEPVPVVVPAMAKNAGLQEKTEKLRAANAALNTEIADLETWCAARVAAAAKADAKAAPPPARAALPPAPDWGMVPHWWTTCRPKQPAAEPLHVSSDEDDADMAPQPLHVSSEDDEPAVTPQSVAELLRAMLATPPIAVPTDYVVPTPVLQPSGSSSSGSRRPLSPVGGPPKRMRTVPLPPLPRQPPPPPLPRHSMQHLPTLPTGDALHVETHSTHTPCHPTHSTNSAFNTFNAFTFNAYTMSPKQIQRIHMFCATLSAVRRFPMPAWYSGKGRKCDNPDRPGCLQLSYVQKGLCANPVMPNNIHIHVAIHKHTHSHASPIAHTLFHIFMLDVGVFALFGIGHAEWHHCA